MVQFLAGTPVRGHAQMLRRAMTAPDAWDAVGMAGEEQAKTPGTFPPLQSSVVIWRNLSWQ